MFYNYQEIFVAMLLLPLVVNILLPLVMLVVWLLSQLVLGKRRNHEVNKAIRHSHLMISGRHQS